jgi:hypothetical protein
MKMRIEKNKQKWRKGKANNGWKDEPKLWKTKGNNSEKYNYN